MEFVLIIICAVVITFSNEITTRQEVNIFNFFFKNSGLFILNILIHTGLLIMLLSATGNFFITVTACTLIFYILTNISFFKYAARNEVFYISDFLLFFKVMKVSDKSNILVTKYNAFSLLPNIFCIVCSAFTAPAQLYAAQRLILFAVGLAAALPSFIYVKRNTPDDFTYFTKGFTLGLLSNTYLYFSEKMSEPEKPGDIGLSVYEPERPSNLGYKPPAERTSNREHKPPAERTSNREHKPPAENAPVLTPNVIVVLSESFWDIEKLPGLKFTEKAAPNFRRLYENCAHGSLIVTPFGGGTCNVESEALTGAPIRYFNISNSFYHRYITRPILSLPRIFCKNGYETIALHTFDKNFYNRDAALSYMGFSTYKAKEDLTDPIYEGTYIADSELTKMIIKAYEQKTKPAFILGISMENHQPYGKNKYADNPIKLLNSGLDPRLKSVAETFAHGLNDADRELAALISYFERVKEPTDIIFFGDHLGALGPNLELYRKTGFVSAQKKLSLQDIKNLYSTEFIIWSNYKSGKSSFPDTSSNFLGNIILNHLGFKKPEFYYFMDEVYEKWRCVNRLDLIIDSSGKMYGHAPEEFRAIDEKYRHLARRLIFEHA